MFCLQCDHLKAGCCQLATEQVTDWSTLELYGSIL